jgi:poly(glycerol-phosphate) alpha-glucosyltransferase
VPATNLPSGRYLSCPIDLSPDAGGQTRAILMRNRIFVDRAGISPTVATFNARTDLAERRATLLERGFLLPEMDTPNIYQHHRKHGWDDPPQDDPRPLVDLSAHKVAEDLLPDGTPFRYTYQSDSLPAEMHDFLRADGSVYLRIPKFFFRDPGSWPTSLLRVAPDNTVSGEFGSVREWFQQYVRMLAGDERTFLFIDSRFNATQLLPLREPNIHALYVLHNLHLRPPRLWSSPFGSIYGRVLALGDEFDALVTLTHRQQDDIAMRRGRGSNMFVIPNPVDMPVAPKKKRPPRRDPNLVTVMARLDRQKHIVHAIRAVVRARAEVPVRLDIYGSGEQQEVLEKEIRRHGAEDYVTLRGHDPAARNSLWTSSAYLLTSHYEGYPLSTLESLSHGCPVIAYDIKYGPREQITDGVDGFLVPVGAVKEAARRLVQLVQDPELVATMSRSALEKARQHSDARFLEDWRQVLEKAVDLKPRRTLVEDVRLDVTKLSTKALQRSATRFGAIRRRKTISFEGLLTVVGTSERSTLESAHVTLTLVEVATGRHVSLPLSVRRRGETFTLSTRVRVADLFDEDEDLTGARLRLQLVWENSTWNTLLGPPTDGGAAGHADESGDESADDGGVGLPLDL